MWQSAALVGALSLGGSAPTEFGTCWASLWPTWIPEAVAVIAATEAPLMKVRRAIIFSSRVVLMSMRLHHSAERSEGATCDVDLWHIAIGTDAINLRSVLGVLQTWMDVSSRPTRSS